MNDSAKPQGVGCFDMSSDDYRKSDGVSRSTLWKFHNATDKRFEFLLNEKKEPTDAMNFGTACHAYLLDESEFKAKFAFGPDVSRSTKEWKAFEATVPAGKIILKNKDLEEIMLIAATLKANKLASNILKGYHEKTFFWRDEETGLLCKARPDSIHFSAGIIADLKTTNDSAPEEFLKKIYDMGYHMQAAYYLDGVKAAFEQSGQQLELGRIPDKFVFVAVENELPFESAIYDLPDFFIDEGRRLYRTYLDRYKAFLGAAKKSSYPEKIITLEPRAYMFKKEGQK